MSDFSSLQAFIPPIGTLQPNDALSGSNTDPLSIEAAARKQASEFEATFLAALLQPVFEGLARDATFGGGFAEETWTGLLTQEYAKSISSTADLGIADQVYEQIIKLQKNKSE